MSAVPATLEVPHPPENMKKHTPGKTKVITGVNDYTNFPTCAVDRTDQLHKWKALSTKLINSCMDLVDRQ